MNVAKYYLAAVSAFVIWGFFSLVLRPIHNFPSLDILFYRVFVCGVLMLLISLMARRKVFTENLRRFRQLSRKARNRVILLNLGGGLFLTGNWFFFIYVMNHVSVKATSLAYLVCPILTTVLANFLLKEKLSKFQWASVALSTFACLLLSFSALADILYSMIIAGSYAFYLVTQRKNTGFDKFLLLTVQILFSAIILLPFYPAFSSSVPDSSLFYFCIVLIAVLFTIISLFLNLYALNGVTSSTVGMLLNINPIIAFILAVTHFHEKVDSIQATAYGLILLSVILFNQQYLFSRKERSVTG
ncbi:EamA family transporter [Arcticibacter sp. MXS-1]|uniref:EamA family transporter n=1 Tax=Arcticibacter sp. MXS-1 TaxID=3341726 RepID=UPI0035A91170